MKPSNLLIKLLLQLYSDHYRVLNITDKVMIKTRLEPLDFSRFQTFNYCTSIFLKDHSVACHHKEDTHARSVKARLEPLWISQGFGNQTRTLPWPFCCWQYWRCKLCILPLVFFSDFNILLMHVSTVITMTSSLSACLSVCSSACSVFVACIL